MRRVLKLAALLGGFSALAWSLRNRIRIAIHRGGGPDPQSENVTEVVEEAAGEATAGDQATVSASATEKQETETNMVEETGEEGDDSPSDESVNPN